MRLKKLKLADFKSFVQFTDVVFPSNLAAVVGTNGGVNKEFQLETQRKQYLDSQHLDLVQALETLEKAIAKIDCETRQYFKQIFDKINCGIEVLFLRLFGGAQAYYLWLTGNNFLDTEVTGMPRLPLGKRNSSIFYYQVVKKR